MKSKPWLFLLRDASDDDDDDDDDDDGDDDDNDDDTDVNVLLFRKENGNREMII